VLDMNIVGFAGYVGSGKTLAASFVPGAHCLQWADPIYAGLSAMLEIPESVLRDRTQKEREISVAGATVTPRQLLRTLGTEWGRDLVDPDLWVRLTMHRVEQLHAEAVSETFAVCGTRFPNEVDAIRRRGGVVIWIERPGIVAGPHVSDRLIGPGDCDGVIDNDGAVDELRDRVVLSFRHHFGVMPCSAI